jgi:hypothetical protein
MWSAGKEGPTAQVLPELKLADIQAATNRRMRFKQELQILMIKN